MSRHVCQQAMELADLTPNWKKLMCRPDIISASYETCFPKYLTRDWKDAQATVNCQLRAPFLLLVPSGSTERRRFASGWADTSCAATSADWMFFASSFTSLQPAFPCQDMSQLVHAVVQEWKSQSESYYWNMNVSQAMCHCFSSRVVCICSRSSYLIDDSRPKYRQNNSLRRTRLGF